jgi:glutamate-1-semialdehyde 2,1-aminomutase
MSNQWTREPAPFPTPVPNSLGIPRSTANDVLIAPFNDLERAAELIERHRDELAAVLVEPMQRTIPPRPGFLEGLREVTRRHEIPLVFDEVVTAFRLGLGGAQSYYGVVPDLCALGKSISAGHPFAAVCGRGELMALAEGARQVTGGYVALTGTYSGNPISSVAALAAIEELEQDGVYETLFARGRRLWAGLEARFGAAGIPVRLSGEPPAFQVWFTADEIVDFRSLLACDARRGMRFTGLLLERGVMKAHEKFFLSTAHTDEDIDLTLDACEDAIRALAVCR